MIEIRLKTDVLHIEIKHIYKTKIPKNSQKKELGTQLNDLMSSFDYSYNKLVDENDYGDKSSYELIYAKGKNYR